MKRLYLFLLLTTACLAQAPDTLWTRRIDNAGYQTAHAALALSNGEIMIGGVSDPPGIVFGANGDSLHAWRSSGALWSDGICALIKSPTGACFASSSDWYYHMHTFSRMGTICELTASGVATWCVPYANPNQGSATPESDAAGLAGCANGDLLLTGRVRDGIGQPVTSVWALRITNAGDTVWNRIYHGDQDSARAIVEGEDGEILIVGSTADSGSAAADIFLLKLAANGDSLWFRRYGGPGNDEARAVLLMPDGGFLIAGYVTGTDNATRACLLRTDQNGDSLWQRTCGGAGSAFHALHESTYGSYVAAGYTTHFSHGGNDMLLYKVDSDGDSVWMATFGGSGDEIANAIDLTLDSGYVIAGSTTSFGAQGTDWWILRTETDLAAEAHTPQPRNFEFESFPNPFNASTEIRFTLARESLVSLRVFDLNGRLVATLADNMLSAGTHTRTFDGAAFSSGLYFCRLESGQFAQTRKLVLLK
jgi:hypothetical protein